MPQGGKRENAGRKRKCDEIQLIEKLKPLDEVAFSALEEGINKRDFPFIKLFFEYRFGKPNQLVELSGKLGVETITGMKVI